MSRPSAPSLGLDIVETARVARLARRNPRFLKRVFSAAELRYCLGKRNQWQHLAVRFAAKEAVWKAVGGGALSLKDIEIRRSADGRPGVVLKGKPAPFIQVSLSHTADYAAAVAVRG